MENKSLHRLTLLGAALKCGVSYPFHPFFRFGYFIELIFVCEMDLIWFVLFCLRVYACADEESNGLHTKSIKYKNEDETVTTKYHKQKSQQSVRSVPLSIDISNVWFCYWNDHQFSSIGVNVLCTYFSKHKPISVLVFFLRHSNSNENTWIDYIYPCDMRNDLINFQS